MMDTVCVCVCLISPFKLSNKKNTARARIPGVSFVRSTFSASHKTVKHEPNMILKYVLGTTSLLRTLHTRTYIKCVSCIAHALGLGGKQSNNGLWGIGITNCSNLGAIQNLFVFFFFFCPIQLSRTRWCIPPGLSIITLYYDVVVVTDCIVFVFRIGLC